VENRARVACLCCKRSWISLFRSGVDALDMALTRQWIKWIDQPNDFSRQSCSATCAGGRLRGNDKVGAVYAATVATKLKLGKDPRGPHRRTGANHSFRSAAPCDLRRSIRSKRNAGHTDPPQFVSNCKTDCKPENVIQEISISKLRSTIRRSLFLLPRPPFRPLQ
jgi:hypothetical protein